MSVILDALRRQSADGEPSGEEGMPERTASSDAVLATLGYGRRSRSRPSMRSLILGGVAAVGIGFIGLTLLIFLLTPSPTPTPAPTAAPTQPVRAAGRGNPPASTAVREPVAPPLTEPPRAETPLMAPRLPDEPRPSQSQSQSPALAPPRNATGALRETTPVRTVRPEPVAPRRARPAPPPEPDAAVPLEKPAPPQPPAEDHFRLALYYQRIGDYDNALAHYRSLLEQQDASAEVHNNLGLLYQERGNLDDATKQFQRAIALDPTYVLAHNNLGVTLMRSNRPDAAAAEFRVALAEDPRNVESLVNLALVQKAAGRVADARELLRRALQIDPRNAGSHYNFAVVADESGDETTAVEHYRAFLRLGAVSHAELAAQVRARLTALGAG